MLSLNSFANELLDEIISYLPLRSDQLSAMSTCRSFHWPAARSLYRNVSVSDYKARRFFKTITESTIGYEYFIRTLKYRATSNTDVHLNHLLLRDAIPRLYNLEHLSLSIRSSLSPFLIYILKKFSIVSDIILFTDTYSSRCNIDNTFHRLDKLRKFSVHGDIKLLKLLTYRKIHKVEITGPISDTDFAYVMTALTFPESKKNPVMRDLTMTFDRPLRRHIVYAIIRIAESFPNISRLSIRGLRLNALVSKYYNLK